MWPCLHWPWKRSQSVPIPRGNGSVRRVTFLHFISPRCILLSACLSHSSHPLYSYRQHVTSFALLRGPANETASPFLPVTSLKQLQWVCGAQAAAQSLHQQGRCTHFMISFPVCWVNLNNSLILMFSWLAFSVLSKEEGATLSIDKMKKSMFKSWKCTHENVYWCLHHWYAHIWKCVKTSD